MRKIFAACAVFSACAAGIAIAGTLADSQARLKIGQDALVAGDAKKAADYCDAAIIGLPAEASDVSDMVTADATECQAKALILQNKNQDACDLVLPVIDMLGVSKAPGKAAAIAKLKAITNAESASGRCE